MKNSQNQSTGTEYIRNRARNIFKYENELS